jgi:hypothetical protein
MQVPSVKLKCRNRVARKGEAWWPRRDSNLQPDRYEREDGARLS